MFSAYGGDAKAWPSLGGLPGLSPCLLFSLQPRSFLSPPEKGNHSLASSTMEQALVFAVPRSSWRRGLCSAPLAATGMPGAQHRAGHQSKPLPKHTHHIWALGDETGSNPDTPRGCLMLSPCSSCRAGHNFPEPGKRRMQPPGFGTCQMHCSRAKCTITAPNPPPKPSSQAPSQLQSTAGGNTALSAPEFCPAGEWREFPAWEKGNGNPLSQQPTPHLQHTWELKQLWTPAQPRTGSCGSAQHLAPSMAEKTHFPLSTACFVTQGCCGTALPGTVLDPHPTHPGSQATSSLC